MAKVKFNVVFTILVAFFLIVACNCHAASGVSDSETCGICCIDMQRLLNAYLDSSPDIAKAIVEMQKTMMPPNDKKDKGTSPADLAEMQKRADETMKKMSDLQTNAEKILLDIVAQAARKNGASLVVNVSQSVDFNTAFMQKVMEKTANEISKSTKSKPSEIPDIMPPQFMSTNKSKPSGIPDIMPPQFMSTNRMNFSALSRNIVYGHDITEDAIALLPKK